MKQLLRYSLFLLTAGFLFTACQKELNFETENAQGTLVKDANNNCAPFTVNGSYVKAIALDASNYVDVQVNITQVGNYVIRTNTVNGYYFYDSSSVAILGVNTFRLKAYGTPLAASFDDLTVTFNNSTCSLSNVVTATAGTTTAEFTLAGAPNACAGAAQTNNFFVNVPTFAVSHKDTIYVNVTRAGSYTITATTSPANGLSFSKSGNFTTIGPNQQVILEATGTPTTSGAIPYTINTTSPASTCGFNLTVGGPATFTMICGGVTFAGIYQEGTPIALGTNTMTIPITGVTGTGGSYFVTATNNNITFTGFGVLTPTSTSITLQALPGTPSIQGSFFYNIAVGGGIACNIVVSYLAPPPPATYAINCGTAATQTGTFQAGTALTAASKVTISVTPTAVGAYTITTDTLNGVSYKGTGIFTTVFTQNVDLIANPVNNLPAAAGTFVHRTYGGTVVCNNLSVTYVAAPLGVFRCKIADVLTDFNLNDNARGSYFPNPGAPANADLIIFGNGTSPMSFSLEINKALTLGTVGTGTYLNTLAASVAGGYVLGASHRDINDIRWGPKALLPGPPDNFRIIINNLNSTRVVGTFDGTIRNIFNGGTSTLNVTEGVFNLPIQ
jgi:hypothetical protein